MRAVSHSLCMRAWAGTEAGYNAIAMSGLQHGFIRDVTIINADSGVLLNDVSFVTVSGLTMRTALPRL